MEFVAVHMKTASILAIHKEETLTGKHYLCDCIISPDLGSFILKPNAMYVLNFCRGEFRNVMKVLSLKENRLGRNYSVISENICSIFFYFSKVPCVEKHFPKSGSSIVCSLRSKILLVSSCSGKLFKGREGCFVCLRHQGRQGHTGEWPGSLPNHPQYRLQSGREVRRLPYPRKIHKRRPLQLSKSSRLFQRQPGGRSLRKDGVSRRSTHPISRGHLPSFFGHRGEDGGGLRRARDLLSAGRGGSLVPSAHGIRPSEPLQGGH